MFGVRIAPPNGSIQPNPMSSITMYITFGAPSGASGGIGNAASESAIVRPTFDPGSDHPPDTSSPEPSNIDANARRP